MFYYVFIFISFNYAPILCVHLFACSLDVMLYSAPHSEYMLTAVSANCIYLPFVMPLCTYKLQWMCFTRGAHYGGPKYSVSSIIS